MFDGLKTTGRGIDYNGVRAAVLRAARAGRCTMLPAGARDNPSALILVDGEVVGPASTFGHFVRESPDATPGVFREKVMVAEWNYLLPERLRE